MKFLLDTNFLLLPGMFGVDIFSELKAFERPEFYTIEGVITELERLSRRNKDAKTALLFIKKEGVEVIPTPKNLPTDDALVELGQKGFVVCTQDRVLIQKLRRKNCRIVTMRQQKYVQEV